MNKPNAYFQAFAGHLVDLYRLARFRFVTAHSYTKFRQLSALRKTTGATQMIETGTYRGVTANRCARVFDRVYTIELDQTLAQEAAKFLAPKRNVEVIQGDALVELPKVLAKPDVRDLVIFLDGHFSGGDTAHGDLAEPACEEVRVLASHKDKIKAILVDDFRCFGVDAGWPSKSALLRTLEQHFPEFDLAVHLDQVIAKRK